MLGLKLDRDIGRSGHIEQVINNGDSIFRGMLTYGLRLRVSEEDDLEHEDLDRGTTEAQLIVRMTRDVWNQK